ncbi:Hypothetical protein NTJ_06007 [Nesidiocoris tenuis]|uniref:Uncharacterized protein n=1 Tax=Nesidiocoris tenuis TaxID=355587 RepID=A0ABN7AMC2_9HEMI|nr:Hypothetical protein NTJ_06007 [Nesidiocoris tenuis]
MSSKTGFAGKICTEIRAPFNPCQGWHRFHIPCGREIACRINPDMATHAGPLLDLVLHFAYPAVPSSIQTNSSCSYYEPNNLDIVIPYTSRNCAARVCDFFQRRITAFTQLWRQRRSR